MLKIINEYCKEAQKLHKRSHELALEISIETDVDRLHSLERRKYTIETERNEILRDIKDMLAYLTEEEFNQWQECGESA